MLIGIEAAGYRGQRLENAHISKTWTQNLLSLLLLITCVQYKQAKKYCLLLLLLIHRDVYVCVLKHTYKHTHTDMKML